MIYYFKNTLSITRQYCNTVETMASVPDIDKTKSTITLVTSFYNLKDVEPEVRRDKNPDTYWQFFHLTLRINHPLVIYTSPDLVDKFYSLRESLGDGLREKTLVIAQDFSNLEYAHYVDKVKKCREINPIRNRNLGKDTPAYCVLMWYKFVFLKDAAELNHFNTSHFGWIDLGIKQVCKEVDPSVFTNVSDKIHIMLMRHPNPNDLSNPENIKNFFSFIQGNIASGYFTGSRDNVINFYHEVDNLIQKYTSKDIAPIDEQLISFLVGTKPELFTFFYGDYTSLLLNYHQPRADMRTILLNLSTCRSLGLYNHGRMCGEAAFKSLKAGILRYHEEEIHTLLVDFFICVTSLRDQLLFASKSENTTLPVPTVDELIKTAKEIVQFYADRAILIPHFRKSYNNNPALLHRLFDVYNFNPTINNNMNESQLSIVKDIKYDTKPNDRKTGLIIHDNVFDFRLDTQPNLILDKKHSEENDSFINDNCDSSDLHLYINLDTPVDKLEFIVNKSSNSLNRYIACVYLGLKFKDSNTVKSIGYLSLAMAIKPERPESYSILGTIHREKGNNMLSTEFSIEPKVDLASFPSFTSDPICNKSLLEGLYFNVAICAYYTSKIHLGKEACDKLLVYSDQYRDHSVQISQFYLETLPTIFKTKLTPKTLRVPGTDKYYEPLNPSITTKGDKYLILCRTVNYTINKDKSFIIHSPDRISRTENLLLELDSDFNIIETHHVIDKSNRITYMTMWIGIEDGRLFWWDDQLYFTACFADSYSDNTIRMGLMKLNSQYQITRFIGFEPALYTKCEKNWIPIIDNNKLKLIYSYDQRNIVVPEFDPRESPAERITCRKQDNYRSDANLSWIKGGSVTIPYKDGYLSIIHQTPQIHKYYHRFIYMDSEYTPIKMSPAWTLGQANLEYITGLCWSLDKKSLVITYGIDDNFAYLAVIDPSVVKLNDI